MKVKESIKNFFRLTTKQIAGMAVLSALAVVLSLVLHVSIFPQVAFLEYDMADIPIFLGTFMYGTFAGIIMTVVVSVIQGVTVSAGSGFIGINLRYSSRTDLRKAQDFQRCPGRYGQRNSRLDRGNDTLEYHFDSDFYGGSESGRDRFTRVYRSVQPY